MIVKKSGISFSFAIRSMSSLLAARQPSNSIDSKAMFNQLSADQLNIGKHDPLPDDLIDFLLGIIPAGFKQIRETLKHNFPDRLLRKIRKR